MPTPADYPPLPAAIVNRNPDAGPLPCCVVASGGVVLCPPPGTWCRDCTPVPDTVWLCCGYGCER